MKFNHARYLAPEQGVAGDLGRSWVAQLTSLCMGWHMRSLISSSLNAATARPPSAKGCTCLPIRRHPWPACSSTLPPATQKEP